MLTEVARSTSVPSFAPRLGAGLISTIVSVNSEPAGMTTRPSALLTGSSIRAVNISPALFSLDVISRLTLASIAVPASIRGAAGGAGTVTQIALGTAQTDTLTVIERVFCDVAALATLLTGLSGFGTGLGGTMRDGRMQGILAQTSTFTKNSAVVRSITAGGARLSAGEWTPGPWIVRGSVRQLLVEADALNTAMLVTAMGYEYNILPTERLP